MKKLFQYLVFMVFCVSLLSVTASCKKEKKEAPRGVGELVSNPAGADIYYNGKKIGVTPKEIKGVPKKYAFKLSHKGFKDEFVILDLKDGKNTFPKIDLTPMVSSCLVTTSPAGVNVIINGKSFGVTPMVIRDLPMGKHEISLAKSGYADKIVTLQVDDERPKKIVENLFSNIGSIEFVSEPGEVSVFMNGELLGETPFKKELEAGKYTLTFKKANYYDVTSEVIVESGKNKKISHSLQLLPSAVKINCPIEGAEIYLDGKLAGKTPALIENLSADREYEVYIKAPKYVSDAQKITLTPGKTHEFYYDLKRNVGDLEVVTNVPGVNVYVDGHKYGVVQQGESEFLAEVFSVKDLSIGMHELKITHKRAKPDVVKKRFEIKANEVTRIEGINLWIPNIELIMKDGSREIGLIKSENKRKGYIFFESKPGLRYSINYSDIEKIVPLSMEE